MVGPRLNPRSAREFSNTAACVDPAVFEDVKRGRSAPLRCFLEAVYEIDAEEPQKQPSDGLDGRIRHRLDHHRDAVKRLRTGVHAQKTLGREHESLWWDLDSNPRCWLAVLWSCRRMTGASRCLFNTVRYSAEESQMHWIHCRPAGLATLSRMPW